MYLCMEIAKQADISFSIPPPHKHTHCLELQKAYCVGAFGEALATHLHPH